MPDAVSICYDLPLSDYPTNVREAAAALAHAQAERRGVRCAVRCGGNGSVLTADDAPLFAVRGTRVYASPAAESVERHTALRCITAAGLTFEERTVIRDELRGFEELFYFDHRGVTALARCDGHPYMSLMAERVARAAELLTEEFRKM